MKEYICECGKIYTNPQSFNGHKSHCKIHLEKTGNLQLRINIDSKNGNKISNTLKQYHTKNKANTLQKWISEQHTCEKCGKVMTEKFGSGRFCSRSCANSKKHSEETKQKISTTNHDIFTNKHLHSKNVELYNNNPNRCLICNKILSYDKRNNKTCSKRCQSKQISITKKCSYIVKGKPDLGRYIVYKTTYLKDGRYYIGVHKRKFYKRNLV